MSTKFVSISTLGQVENGKYCINKTTEDIYLIEESASVVVQKGVFARIVDRTQKQTVSIYGAKDSSISYYILNSESTKRSFEIEGELNVLEVSTISTEENFLCTLLTENATVDVKNLSVLTNENAKYTQRIDHMVGLTNSNISNVGVALDGAQMVFDTTGYIKKGMAKSKCSQLSRGIVMDDSSSITAKPILLIDEFDCFANHGASIGKMSDEDLFYLMSRGLSKKDAFLLILQGIIRPFIDSIPLEELKEEIQKEIVKRIGE